MSRLGLVAALVMLASSGCGVDLLVGETEVGAEDSGSGTGEGTQTGPGPGDSGGTEPGTSTGPGDETGEGTTVGEHEGTTEGTTGAVEEEGTTSEEIPCEGQAFGGCNELPYCLWYGDPKMGQCALSPCENPEHDCWALGLGDCEAILACAWVGEPELGDCAPIECVPCELLGFEQCVETPTCVWQEVKEVCVS